MLLDEARAPAGVRLYAIGDIHGCDAKLLEVFSAIERDLAVRPAEDFRVILVGDYVDRGAESGAVLQRLCERWNPEHQIPLLGNHDLMFLGALEDPDSEYLETWLANGGIATLASYGIAAVPDIRRAMGRRALNEAMREVVPEHHVKLLAALPLQYQVGDYLFVHAGIRPGVAISAQEPQDLTWIRGPFLESDDDHGVVVVHGHTPGPEVVVRPNRIGIDTGACFGGPLSCIVIEEAGRWLLGPEGPVELAPLVA